MIKKILTTIAIVLGVQAMASAQTVVQSRAYPQATATSTLHATPQGCTITDNAARSLTASQLAMCSMDKTADAQRMVLVQPDGTLATYLGDPVSATATALSECILVSAASTNATNCKASAGRVYGWQFVNTTATLYYLRMYNLAASPTCSSATGFIRTIPVPASTTGNGIVITLVYPIAYATGVSFCFTGGSSSTDNTNAATGVFGAVLYK